MLGGESDCSRNCLHLGGPGVQVPLRSNAAGPYVLSVASFGRGGGAAATGPTLQAVSRFSRDADVLRPSMSKGGVSSPVSEDGPCQLEAPRNFEVCKTASRKDALNPSPEDAKQLAKKPHENWGHALAHQLKRLSVDAKGSRGRAGQAV